MKKTLLITTCSALLAGSVVSTPLISFAQESSESAIEEVVSETDLSESGVDEIAVEDETLQTQLDEAKALFDEKYPENQLNTIKIHKHTETEEYIFYFVGEENGEEVSLVVYQGVEYSATPDNGEVSNTDDASEATDSESSTESSDTAEADEEVSSEDSTEAVDAGAESTETAEPTKETSAVTDAASLSEETTQADNTLDETVVANGGTTGAASTGVLETDKYITVDEASEVVGGQDASFITLELIDSSKLTETEENVEEGSEEATTEKAESTVAVYKFIIEEAGSYNLLLVDAETGEQIETPTELQDKVNQFLSDVDSGAISDDDPRVFWFRQFYSAEGVESSAELNTDEAAEVADTEVLSETEETETTEEVAPEEDATAEETDTTEESAN